jgi:hypothetical protein
VAVGLAVIAAVALYFLLTLLLGLPARSPRGNVQQQQLLADLVKKFPWGWQRDWAPPLLS